MSTADDVGHAATLGGFAAHSRKALADCPFDAAGTGRDRMLAAGWVRGFLHARPSVAAAIDHGSAHDRDAAPGGS